MNEILSGDFHLLRLLKGLADKMKIIRWKIIER